MHSVDLDRYSSTKRLVGQNCLRHWDAAFSSSNWRSQRNYPRDVLHGPPRRGAGLRTALAAQGPSGAPDKVAELMRVYSPLAIKRSCRWGKVQGAERGAGFKGHEGFPRYDGNRGLSAHLVPTPLSERERQHPGTPDEQSDTGGVAEPMACGYTLFEQNKQGEARDPVEVHHPAEKQEPHQAPAAADAESAVLETHTYRATGAPPPMGAKECKRRSALAKTGMFNRGELVNARGEQQNVAEDHVGQTSIGERIPVRSNPHCSNTATRLKPAQAAR